jgi:hypothetical protein
MAEKFFLDKRPHNGYNFSKYVEALNSKINSTDIIQLGGDDLERFEMTKLNFQRISRIYKSYTVNENLESKIKQIDKPQLWMVLTEDWCGDSAQNIPYIAKMAECNPQIDLRILFRDENPDIMDLYLTNGTSRSIPKLVAFDLSGNELFQWGPRPEVGQKVVDNAKAEGKTKEQFLNELHLWYGRNRGKNLEEEFSDIIDKVFSYSS